MKKTDIEIVQDLITDIEDNIGLEFRVYKVDKETGEIKEKTYMLNHDYSLYMESFFKSELRNLKLNQLDI